MLVRAGVRDAALCIAVISMLGAQAVYAQDAAPPTPTTVTLREIVLQALERSDRAMASRDLNDQAKLSLRLARSAFAPKVTPNIFGSFGQTDISNQSYGLAFSQRFITGTEVRATVGATTAQNQLGNFYSTDTTFQVTQPLLRGFGRGIASRELANAEAGAAEAGRQRMLVEQQVAIDAATAYYRVVRGKLMLDIAEKAFERARQLRDASNAKLAVGKVSKLDVFRAEQLVSQADLQVLDARADVDDAKDELRLLLNRGPEYEFDVSLEAPGSSAAPAEQDAVTSALANRLELRTADERVNQARRAVRSASNQLLPQVDMNVAMTRREAAETLGSSFGLDKFRLAAFATVSAPFDRTPETVAHESAVIALNQSIRDRAALAARVAQEVRRALRQVARLVRSLELADESIAAAGSEVELAMLRYQRGLSNNLDVVTAEGNLLAARGRRVALLADLALAQLTLRAATGTLDPRNDIR